MQALKILILVLLPLFSFSQVDIKSKGVEDIKAKNIINEVSSKLRQETPISFEFTLSSMKDNTNYRGSLTLNADKYFGNIGRDKVYCDGTSIWVYQAEINEVNINNIEDVDNDVLNITKFISEANTKFRPKLIRQEAENNIIDLLPREKSEFSKIRIYVNKNTSRLTKIELIYNGGHSFVYNINSYKTKIKVKSSEFSFNPKEYPSALIVDLR